MFIFTIMTTMLMYIYVDFSNEIIVFPLCTAKGGWRVIKFVFVFVFFAETSCVHSLVLLVLLHISVHGSYR